MDELRVLSTNKTNQILGAEPLSCENTTVDFSGSNNILFLEEGVRLSNSTIRFEGDNAILYLCKSRHRFSADICLEDDAACIIGRNVFMNRTDPLKVRCRKGTSIAIGNDSLLSLSIVIDTKTDRQDVGEPSNMSILIGQHVWLGQNVMIKGGSTIRSGAVIGSSTTVSGQLIPPDSCWGTRNGQLQKLYEDIVFLKRTIRNTPREGLSENEMVSEKQMQMIREITKDSWEWVQEMLEEVQPAEERLVLLRDSSDRRKYRRPKYNDSKKDEISDTDNQIVGNYTEENSRITFRGKGNVLYVENGVRLLNTHIAFNGDNSLIYLSKNPNPYCLRVSMHSDTTLFMGSNNHFQESSPVVMSVAEAQSVIIGNNCSFGTGIWFRTSDQHPIYARKTGKRLNPPKSILVGDKVALSNGSLVFKGRKIGIKEHKLIRNRYMRMLEKLQRTTDMKKRINILKKI